MPSRVCLLVSAAMLSAVLSAAAQEPAPSDAFHQGQADRNGWETWVAGLPPDQLAGAEYWAGQRSLPHPGPCAAPTADAGSNWSSGCFAAQQRLSPSDVRRKTEPEYRRGWNNPESADAGKTPAVAMSAQPRPQTESLDPRTDDSSASAAVTQFPPAGFDTDCRPLPVPGYIMSPQPQSPDCLRLRERFRRAQEAEERRRQAQAEAAAEAEQERLGAERLKCESATPEDVQSTVEQEPMIFGVYFRVLDVTQPRFNGQRCKSEVMTNKGIIDAWITFQDFDGKQFIQVRVMPHISNN
jgi:hypothetical protein